MERSRGGTAWNNVAVALLFLLVFSANLASAAPLPRAPARSWQHPGNAAMENPLLFEGDIVTRQSSGDKTVVSSDLKLWPNGVIPFVVESSLGRHVDAIKDAMAGIEAKTCIRFVPRTYQRNYITIFAGRGCYSAIGRLEGPQPVSLGEGCIFRGTITHELLHSVGFLHEHSRSDRDTYIEVFLKNIQPENVSQFQSLHPWEYRILSPFDYGSVMLYGSAAFAKGPGLTTMQVKGGGQLTEVFDKPGMNAVDVARVRMLYRCKAGDTKRPRKK